MKLSIVVPIYNAERYLEECLESVVNQTYREKEIILVDDGSTDASGTICDAYAKQYACISVIHGENRGLSGARNIGMDMATGEYIAFVDADDVLDWELYEILINALESTESDVSACGFQKEYAEFAAVKKQESIPSPFVAEGRESSLLSISSKEHCAAGFVWNKVYRRSVIGNVRFDPEAVLCEDLVFNYEVLSKASRVCVMDLPLYHYRYVSSSLSQKSNPARAKRCLSVLKRVNEWVTENAPFCKEGAYTNYIFWNTKVCEQMLKDPDAELYELVRENLTLCKEYIPRCSFRIRMLANALLKSWQRYWLLGMLVYQCKKLFVGLKKLKKKVL